MTTIRAIRPGAAGLSVEESSTVFDHIAQFASYGFNKSHAAAYADIGFQTAWLKRHKPEAFFAALMNMAIGEIADLATCAGQMKARGIPLMPPHINISQARFAAIQGHKRFGVTYGLAAMRGVGMAAAQAIVAERTANGRFTSFADFKARVGNSIGKKAMTALVQAGACDDIIDTRADGVALAEDRSKPAPTAQMSFFDTNPDMDTRESLEEWTREELLDREFDSLGFWLSGHPLESFRRQGGAKPLTLVGALRDREDLPRQAAIVASVVDWDIISLKSGGMMTILTLSDPFETFEAVVFEDEWATVREHVRKKATLVLNVAPKTDDSGDLRLQVQAASPYTVGLRKVA